MICSRRDMDGKSAPSCSLTLAHGCERYKETSSPSSRAPPGPSNLTWQYRRHSRRPESRDPPRPPESFPPVTASANMMLARVVVGLTLALVHGAQGQCGWNLVQNDCICMKSTDGSLLGPETSTCCRDMGLKTTNSVSADAWPRPPAAWLLLTQEEMQRSR